MKQILIAISLLAMNCSCFAYTSPTSTTNTSTGTMPSSTVGTPAPGFPNTPNSQNINPNPPNTNPEFNSIPTPDMSGTTDIYPGPNTSTTTSPSGGTTR